MSSTVPMSRMMKVQPSTGNEPRTGGHEFLGRERPGDGHDGHDHEEASDQRIAMAMVVLYQGVLALMPANALPLLPVAEE